MLLFGTFYAFLNIKTLAMKHSGKLILIMAAMTAVLSSCATLRTASISAEQEYNLAWVGRTHSEIVMAYGAPDRVEADGAGGQILIYEELIAKYDTDVDPHFGMFRTDYMTRVSEEKSYAHFFLHSDGICYLVRSNRMMPNGQAERDHARVVGIIGGAGILTAIVTSVVTIISARNMMARFAF